MSSATFEFTCECSFFLYLGTNFLFAFASSAQIPFKDLFGITPFIVSRRFYSQWQFNSNIPMIWVNRRTTPTVEILRGVNLIYVGRQFFLTSLSQETESFICWLLCCSHFCVEILYCEKKGFWQSTLELIRQYKDSCAHTGSHFINKFLVLEKKFLNFLRSQKGSTRKWEPPFIEQILKVARYDF